MAQREYTAPAYVSDGDTYYDSDWNQFQIVNAANPRLESVQYSSEIALGSHATDFSVNFGNGNRQAATLTGHADITLLTSDLTCGNYTLRLTLDTDSLTYAFDTDAVKLVGGTAPSASSDGGAEDICGFYYSGVKFYLVKTGNFK